MILGILNIEGNLVPGVSFKNLFIYLGFVVVVVRGMKSSRIRLELRTLHVTYLLLVAYAVLTWIIASYVVHYDNYPAIDNGMMIKTGLLDYYVMFFVFFYALTTTTETAKAIQLVTLISILPQVLTILEVSGITSLGVSPVRDDGRVEGALGEANMYAAYIVFFLPTYIAHAVSSRGIWRMTWIGALLLGLIVLLMTVSRGGLVGLGVGAIVAGFMFRRQIPVAKLAGFAIAGMVLSVIVLFTVSSEFRSLITDRLFSESRQADIGSASSGRADFWLDALKMMTTKPITFITGFGWRAYWSMPFQYSPHNTYLNYWFNLGLPGLICLIYPFFLVIRTAARVSRRAATDLRYTLIAFVFGMIAMCVSIFFVELYSPWLYIWAYIGLVMRATLLSEPIQAATSMEPNPIKSGTMTSYGWLAQTPGTRTR